MDIVEYGAQKRKMERESAARAKAASADPRASSGRGGFQRGTAPSEEFDAPPKKRAPSSAAEMGGAEDVGEAPVEYGQDSLNYLGHMAGDNVTREGHNNVPLTGQQGFGMIGSMAPQRYMGHFAGNDVMREGHNTVPKSAVSKKISHLVKEEGKPQKQAVAIAKSMERAGRLTKEGGYVRVKKH